MTELQELLKKVPKYYEDFYEGVQDFIESEEEEQIMVDFLKKNPDASTSDVLKALDLIFVNDVEVDDDES